MKSVLYVLLIGFILSACHHTQPSIIDSNDKNTDYPQLLGQKEREQVNKEMDTLGTLVSTIEFQVKALQEDLDIYENGIVPWISLENPQEELSRLMAPDLTILPFKKVKLIIDYPLNTPAVFVLESSGDGFSRKQLIQEISKKYKQIYAEEENMAKIKTLPLEKREGLINRNQTDGKYGIWGHDLGDMDLSSIDVYKNDRDEICLILGIES